MYCVHPQYGVAQKVPVDQWGPREIVHILYFISSGSYMVKRLRHDPLIIERTISIVLSTHKTLHRPLSQELHSD